MKLFDLLVTEALKNQQQFSSLRIVVEKELLHHDILRILSHNNLLKGLTFIGGTCLRCCYNGTRLSEDLDFTGGHNFSKETLSDMGEILIDMLQKKYDLSVQVSTPIKESHNVDTWKVKIETRPESKNLPSQRINIDICALPSYEIKPTMILNHYNVDMGTTGLIVQAQSREEIFADKLIALALRPNRIKYRDLWDIMWLHSKNITPRYELIRKKLNDRQVEFDEFISLFETRKNLLLSDLTLEKEFRNEMTRFLPIDQVNQVLNQENFWNFIVYLIKDLFEEIMKVYQG